MIKPAEISSDEDLARRILVRARSIAPCLNSIPEDDDRRLDAIAILKGVIAEVPAPGARRVKSRSRNGTSISYNDVAGAFSPDDILGLRSLCAAAPSGLPVGSFPEARPLDRQWPEGSYS
ncbi:MULTISPECIES: hypothetical protein [Cryobacterium]|uniref:hypothetical protein n=1 Tax=Cryobacterium TaxID=69578 RepID=UPI000CD493A6|nr:MULTISPECIES: hypothetical protein [Cryobacterium]POH63630.1 hypothetical protein C3B60_16070 [Cryobacterium zongtaii]TFC45581.1 hypothetical protein E3O57_08015 [Cryobacterium sp. TMN-39-2]